jgi:hypothetical protein
MEKNDDENPLHANGHGADGCIVVRARDISLELLGGVWVNLPKRV